MTPSVSLILHSRLALQVPVARKHSVPYRYFFFSAKMTITTNAQERTYGRANLSEVRGRL